MASHWFAPQATWVRDPQWTFSTWELKWLYLTLFCIGKLYLGVWCAGPVELVTRCLRCGPGYLDVFSKKKSLGNQVSGSKSVEHISQLFRFFDIVVTTTRGSKAVNKASQLSSQGHTTFIFFLFLRKIWSLLFMRMTSVLKKNFILYIYFLGNHFSFEQRHGQLS